jgi:hypothetical protein
MTAIRSTGDAITAIGECKEQLVVSVDADALLEFTLSRGGAGLPMCHLRRSPTHCD